jgi:dihydroneopterin aldolase
MSEERDKDSQPWRDRQRVMIRGLEVWSIVGVPDEEREEAQRLLVDVDVVPARDFSELGDQIGNAVDYFALSQKVKAVAESGEERRLIETLAADIATVAMEDEAVLKVTVRIRKFILPDTEFVGVELTRSRSRGRSGRRNPRGHRGSVDERDRSRWQQRRDEREQREAEEENE